jgi:hypothetical protein
MNLKVEMEENKNNEALRIKELLSNNSMDLQAEIKIKG